MPPSLKPHITNTIHYSVVCTLIPTVCQHHSTEHQHLHLSHLPLYPTLTFFVPQGFTVHTLHLVVKAREIEDNREPYCRPKATKTRRLTKRYIRYALHLKNIHMYLFAANIRFFARKYVKHTFTHTHTDKQTNTPKPTRTDTHKHTHTLIQTLSSWGY